MFWNEYLPKNGINVPKLSATTNPHVIYHHINPDKEYISKPEYGTGGDGIKLIRGKDIKPTDLNHLIQDKIGSCEYNGARTYRVVTTYDGEVLVIYEFKNGEKITSNVMKGATVVERVDVPEIEQTVEELCKLHTRDFNFCFSIGWDLMVDCEDKDPTYTDVYVLEGNWPSGLYGNDVNKNDKFIEMVNKKAKPFYTLNNI
jgi:glutathione synthase/RimK-type ligase-like ATP-grasp enzyme|tara:strand:- start:5819 stop:6421 length:603 start_codon:yes stop_codon:yes gene_type:complete